MGHFLLTYDRTTQTADVRSFDDALSAFDEFALVEARFMGDANIEVVLLAARSEDDLRVSHPNFFIKGDLLPA